MEFSTIWSHGTCMRIAVCRCTMEECQETEVSIRWTTYSYFVDFEVSSKIFGDSSKDVGASLKIIGGSPMPLKDLWRLGRMAGGRQCQGCSRCCTRGYGQESTSAMPRYWLRPVCGSRSCGGGAGLTERQRRKTSLTALLLFYQIWCPALIDCP